MKYEILKTGSKGNCIIEMWKPIEDFKDKYEISNLGRIKNKQTNHIYKLTNKNGGYFSIILYDNKQKRSTRIHREVAKAFIPNPNNYKQINHIDLNKQNNKVSNLEWCNASYNTKHGIINGANTLKGLKKYQKNKGHNKYGYIYQYDLNMNFIKKYYDITEANKKTNVCKRNILQCINHQEGRKQAGGYIWIRESEVVNNDL